MIALRNPALEQFVASLGGVGREVLVAQVIVVRKESGFELRHVQDRVAPRESLRAVALTELRTIAEWTAGGAFRPLKSAPNLQPGWRSEPKNDSELGDALNEIYPGFLADWFAARSEAPPLTHYREFTERQTGMYRITTMLDDEQAGNVIRACCNARFCLKRRLWTVTGLAGDSPEQKSIIPCLEPCAVLLEFARKAVRLEQDEETEAPRSKEEMEAMRVALESALNSGGPASGREADFNEPTNPRRLQLALEKLRRKTS